MSSWRLSHLDVATDSARKLDGLGRKVGKLLAHILHGRYIVSGWTCGGNGLNGHGVGRSALRAKAVIGDKHPRTELEQER